MKKQNIDVSAFIWPAYTGDEPRTRLFWPDGEGEWQTVKTADAKFDGHLWPRKPLLGYQNEADPKVMEEQIELATSHGVNVFIYDWYWFDDRPFLEQCLNDGFLKAKNTNDMKFYLMWANHDANYVWDKRNSDKVHRTVIWNGTVGKETFRKIGMRWIENYFGLENYYRIDGKPVFAIYELPNFIAGMGGLDAARAEMEWLDAEAAAHGLGGVHYQLIHRGSKAMCNVSGVDGDSAVSYDGLLEKLPFESITHYQYVHFTKISRDYPEVMEDVRAEWKRLADLKEGVKYWPHVSLGWDNNPRFWELRPSIMTANTPENIEAALRDAKAEAERTGAPMVTINSWNEWTEGSYLLPDDLYGYGYLDAVKHVFLDEE